MARKEILCAFGVDVDAVAGWLGSYGGEDSPDDISRGLFAGEIGSPRLLDLFATYDMKTTWFIPGHSIETFPEQMKMVVDAGHEVGTHGYSHENPVAMTPQQERDVLEKCIGLVEDLTGKTPVGNVAPWWEPSSTTTSCCWSTVTSTIIRCSTTTSPHTTLARATSGRRSTTLSRPRSG
ncbi:MAG TPA: polysaccharide deacetylase family protein [Rubrobacteraceae bacterium]|nr:polysaccharide deacetylase family protein [Rubrobacteraceae bacterium]